MLSQELRHSIRRHELSDNGALESLKGRRGKAIHTQEKITYGPVGMAGP